MAFSLDEFITKFVKAVSSRSTSDVIITKVTQEMTPDGPLTSSHMRVYRDGNLVDEFQVDPDAMEEVT